MIILIKRRTALSLVVSTIRYTTASDSGSSFVNPSALTALSVRLM